ncbi:MAG: VOC family protein [Betaproteobacteria bacterium]|nr:MAG: VOC family protein [Betaproteobacteria bacterium]
MSIQLRQIALVAPQLASAVDDLSTIFGIEVCHVDPGVGIWGLENSLLPVGRNFLEVVAPVKDGTAASRYLQRRGGAGGYMVICQTETLANQNACRQRAAAVGVRVAYEDNEREGFRIMQLHPRDLEAAFFEIDWDVESDFTGRWEPAGGSGWTSHVRTERVSGFTGVELQCEDPAELAKKWAHIADVPVTSENDHPVIALNNARLRFVGIEDGRGPGLGGVDLTVDDRDTILAQAKKRNAYISDDQVMVCGTRFYLL